MNITQVNNLLFKLTFYKRLVLDLSSFSTTVLEICFCHSSCSKACKFTHAWLNSRVCNCPTARKDIRVCENIKSVFPEKRMPAIIIISVDVRKIFSWACYQHDNTQITVDNFTLIKHGDFHLQTTYVVNSKSLKSNLRGNAKGQLLQSHARIPLSNCNVAIRFMTLLHELPTSNVLLPVIGLVLV